MEEILASIRRIIADDSGAAAPQAAPGPQQGVELEQREIDALMGEGNDDPASSEVLELTRPVTGGSAPAFTPVRGSDVAFRDEELRQAAPVPPPPPQAARPAPVPAPAAAPPRRDEALMSPASTAAVSAAFNSLAATVLSENARTLEDLVREMMRPMLKDWLDENLPGLVERIVRAEIERVARGGR